MSKIEDLGKQVKQKYPQYASYSDADVGQKILDKYPNAYKEYRVPEAPVIKKDSKSYASLPTEARSTASYLPGEVGRVGNLAYEGFKQLPGVKQAGQVVGGLTGLLGGAIGGAVGAVGGAIKGASQGTGVLKTAGQEAVKGAKDTAQFGYDVGKEAAPAAIAGVGGKLVQAPMAAMQISSGVGKAIEGDYKGAAVDIGMGALSAHGAIKDKGFLVSESLKNLGSPSLETRVNAANDAKDLMQSVIAPKKGMIQKFEIKRGKSLRDIAGFMAQEKAVPEIGPDRRLGWASSIAEQEGKLDEADKLLTQHLEKTPRTVSYSWSDVQNGVNKAIDKGKSFATAIERKEAKQVAEEIIKAEKEGAGAQPSSLQMNDIKRGMWRMSYTHGDPVSSLRAKIGRLVGHEIAGQIDEKTNNPFIQDLNEVMGKRMDAIEVMKGTTGDVVKGGSLSVLLGKLLGAKVGGMVAGAPGVLAGAHVGGSVAENAAKMGPINAAKQAGALAEKARIVGRETPETAGFLGHSDIFPGKKVLEPTTGERLQGNAERALRPAAQAKGPGATGISAIPNTEKGATPLGSPKAPSEFAGAKNYTTKILDSLKGKSSVSKQFIEDQLKREGIKEGEKKVITNALASEGNKVDVQKFSNKVEESLLPLKRTEVGVFGDDAGTESTRYQGISLPGDSRGDVSLYTEHVYESPIRTSAGQAHFGHLGRGNTSDVHGGLEVGPKENYFAHTRVEDMADGKTRRVIENQSDLFQKGNLERERGMSDEQAKYVGDKAKVLGDSNEPMLKRYNETAKLKPYENTWHERTVREEVKQAAKDGKATLQFPTGETAMKIEGLGRENAFYDSLAAANPIKTEHLEVGKTITQGLNGDKWIITDVLGDGKFKAMQATDLPKVEKLENGKSRINWPSGLVELSDKPITPQEAILQHAARRPEQVETFDVSGKVDQNNPIYKFYESEMSKYLKKKYGATKVTDPQGVTWYQINVPKEAAHSPVEAFGVAAGLGLGMTPLTAKKENKRQ